MLFCIGLVSIQKVKAQSINREEIIPLWNRRLPDGPGPGGEEVVNDKGSIKNISEPRLIVHLPAHPNGTAILVISGGGYAYLNEGKESGPAANWLQSQGVVAFELIYRLPAEHWATSDVPFEDGQRAMRIIRGSALRFGYSEHKVGIMGFSAGGHLAAMIETAPNKLFYKTIDDIDRLDARPDFAVLLYPVITMLPPYNKTRSEKELLGQYMDESLEKIYSPELHVDENTPPTFLAQSLDDPISPAENSKMMFATLQKYHVKSELHLFPIGGHGWGTGRVNSPAHKWLRLFKNWAKGNGFF